MRILGGPLTMAQLTMALLTMALLSMALLSMAIPTLVFYYGFTRRVQALHLAVSVASPRAATRAVPCGKQGRYSRPARMLPKRLIGLGWPEFGAAWSVIWS